MSMNDMYKHRYQRTLQVIIHLVSWILLFGLPFLVFSRDNDIAFDLKLWHHGIVLVSLLAVFYLNFFILTERYLFQKKIPRFFLYNVVLVVVLGVLIHYWKEMGPTLFPNAPIRLGPERSVLVLLFRDIFPLVLVIGLSVAVKATAKWYNLEAQHREEAERRAQAELQNLRQQINPHFLFNTLNNIYALIAISPDKAQNAVHDLSKLLRYALYENESDTVTVAQEAAFITRYVDLMRIRLTADTVVTLDVETVAGSSLTVAPMLLITLVENAFKHGISPNRPSFITLSMHLEGEGVLSFKVVNSFNPKDVSDRSGSGIGLENLRRRLDLLYPGRYAFEQRIEEGTYRIELVLHL